MRSPVFVAVVTYVTLQALVWIQYKFADIVQMRTVEQMQSRGISRGLPLNYHYGISGDWFYLSLVIAAIVWLYWDQWSPADIKRVALQIAIPITLALGVMWSFSGTQEAHVLNKWPTLVSWPHLIYMVPVITVLWLTFFNTPHVHVWVLVAVAIVFLVHMFVGQHMLLGLQKAGNPNAYSWYPDAPLLNKTAWIFLAVLAVAFAWRIWFIATHQ